jgi:hypothetical protein
MAYKQWAVEIHVGTTPAHVFTREFKEEITAKRCFYMIILAMKPNEMVYEARLWERDRCVLTHSVL